MVGDPIDLSARVAALRSVVQPAAADNVSNPLSKPLLFRIVLCGKSAIESFFCVANLLLTGDNILPSNRTSHGLTSAQLASQAARKELTDAIQLRMRAMEAGMDTVMARWVRDAGK